MKFEISDAEPFSWNRDAGQWVVVRWPRSVLDAVEGFAVKHHSTPSGQITRMVEHGVEEAAQTQCVPMTRRPEQWCAVTGDDVVLRDVVLPPALSVNVNRLAKIAVTPLDDLLFTLVTHRLVDERELKDVEPQRAAGRDSMESLG